MHVGMTVTVTSSLIEELRRLAAQSAPEECCGLLLGDEPLAVAQSCANVSDEPRRRFEIDPVALIAAHKAERTGGPRLAGYFHSHPEGPAEPSFTDRALASGDGRAWAIVGAGEVRFWRDGAGGLEPLSTVVTDG